MQIYRLPRRPPIRKPNINKKITATAITGAKAYKNNFSASPTESGLPTSISFEPV